VSRTRRIVVLSAVPMLFCAATHFTPEMGEPGHVVLILESMFGILNKAL
jgi:hypothetical protein